MGQLVAHFLLWPCNDGDTGAILRLAPQSFAAPFSWSRSGAGDAGGARRWRPPKPRVATKEPPAPAEASTWQELQVAAGGGHGKARLRSPDAWRTFPAKVTPKKRQSQLVKTRHYEEVIDIIMDAEHLDEWPTINIATAWHRMAKHARGPVDNSAFRGAEKRLAEAISRMDFWSFSPRELGNIVYAWGVTKYKPERLMRNICSHVSYRLLEFEAQGVSNVLFAMGVLGYSHQELQKAVCKQVPQRLHEFKPQELTVTVYALSRLGHRDPEFLELIAEHVQHRVDEFNAQEVSNLVYAYKILDFKHTGMLTAVCDNIRTRLGELNPQNIANLVYSLGSLGFRHKRFIMAMSAHVPTRLQELKRGRQIETIIEDLKVLQRR